MGMNKKVVLTYGTFDLFHLGHLRLLRRLRELGDELIVGVSTDEFNRQKHKNSFFRFEDRIEIIRGIKYVTHAIPEESWDQKLEDIKKYDVSIFGIGDDWEGKFDHLREHCEVRYIPRTEGVSSSEIRKALSVIDRNHVEDLKKALDIISTLISELD
jgi:glycerol-3-phosphate cytidylyltransferase